MKCYLCDKQLNNLKSKDFVSICSKCIIVMEKSETRQMDMVIRLKEHNKSLQPTTNSVAAEL